MPRTSYPRDRFDDLAEDSGRVGAHRAENPRLRGGVVLLWAIAATVVLTIAGIFGVLLASGRIPTSPGAVESVAPEPVTTPTRDTSYDVLVLNATAESGRATLVAAEIVAAGWAEDRVSAGEAGTSDFATTTVFYPLAGDESAALGLAEVIGGAAVAESGQYAQPDDPETERDESRLLTVVLGLDEPAPASTPTP